MIPLDGNTSFGSATTALKSCSFCELVTHFCASNDSLRLGRLNQAYLIPVVRNTCGLQFQFLGLGEMPLWMESTIRIKESPGISSLLC